MIFLKFNHRKPFVPTRGQPYDRRTHKRGEREPWTSLTHVTLYTPFRKKLLDLIRKNPGISYRGLARLTGRWDVRIHDNVRHLLAARLVHVVKEPGRSYLYLNGVKHTPTQQPVAQVVESMRRVYAFMLQHPEATRQQVIRELGLTRHQAYRAMNALEARGIIKQIRRVTIARLVRPAREEELELLAGGVRRRA